MSALHDGFQFLFSQEVRREIESHEVGPSIQAIAKSRLPSRSQLVTR